MERVQKDAVPSGPTVLSMFDLGLEGLAVTGTKPGSGEGRRLEGGCVRLYLISGSKLEVVQKVLRLNG